VPFMPDVPADLDPAQTDDSAPEPTGDASSVSAPSHPAIAAIDQTGTPVPTSPGATSRGTAAPTTGSDASATDTGAPAFDAEAGVGEDGGSRQPLRRRDATVAGSIGVGVLGVYLWTLLPGVGYSGDTAKWQFLGKVEGIAHATGYPLYLALNQAWVRTIPGGDLAWKVNLLSAVSGAVAIAVLYLVLRLVDVGRPVAAATAATFALTATFWSQAVVAEVYTLHILFLATVTACLVVWRRGGSNRWLLAAMGIYALSFGHHLTTGLALPGIVWLVWSQRRRAVTLRNAAFVAAAIALSASQYLYLLHLSKTGTYHEAYIDDLGDIVDYVTGGTFRASMFNYSWYGLIVARVPLLFRFLREEYLVLLVPAGVGVWRGLRSGPALRDISIYLASLALCTAFYAMNFDVPDVLVFCLPMFLALAVFLGLGLDTWVTWARQHWPDGARVSPAAGTGAALATLVLVVGAVDYHRASQRGETEDAERTEHLIAVAGHDAVLLTDDYHDSELVWYYLLGRGEGKERNLVLANQVTPSQLRQYFTTRRGPVAVAASRVKGTSRPPLYTATARQAVQAAAKGFTITEVAPDVWRISDERGQPR
jgi:hypothetical protein